MSSHPLNLTLRFLLELAALACMSVWGWKHGDNWLRFVLAIGLPIIAAIVWATFAVPDDPSRSGNAPVPVPGIIRLIIELAIFGSAVWALFNSGLSTLSLIMGIIVIVHYFVSYDRIQWLLSK